MASARKGLLSEIERDVLRGEQVADVLRKCLVLGGQARSTELRAWATQELKGYEPGTDLPRYRKVPAGIFLDGVTINARITGQRISPNELPDFVRGRIREEVELRDGVGGLEALTEQAASNGGFVKLSLPMAADVTHYINATAGQPYQTITALYWEVSETALRSTTDQISTSLTELIAELRAGTPDDDETPTPEAAAQAVSLVVHGDGSRVNVTHVHGNVVGSQLQQDSPGAPQLMASALTPTQGAEVARYIEAVRSAIPELGLDHTAEARLNTDLDVLGRELDDDAPRSGLVRELLHSLRATVEGAAASATGTGIVAGVTALLPHFIH